MASNDTTYSTYSCPLCDELDTSEMVQCDSCQFWCHFTCVGVGSDVADRDWSCQRCHSLIDASADQTPTRRTSVSGISMSLAESRKAVALQKLNEEQSIKIEFLNRKYQILEEFNEITGADGVQDKMSDPTNTNRWDTAVQDVSSQFSELSLDNISISLSERERDAINALSPEQVHDNTKTSMKQKREVVKKPVLSPIVNSDATQRYSGSFSSELKTQAESKIPTSNHPSTNPSSSKVKFDIGSSSALRNCQTPTASEPENLTHPLHSTNAGCEFDRNVCGYHQFATRQHSSTPVTLNSYQQAQLPSVISQAGRGNLTASVNHSGYVSNTSGVLTKNQIAARHVFKDLPEFHGRAKEWRIFLSSLKNSTVACGYSDSENLGRLQRCLKGTAKEMVHGRLLHAESVPGVIETLHLIYGRPEAVINELLEDIHKTPSPKNDDLGSLIKFAISVQNLCSTIEATGHSDYLRNPILLQNLTDKLPTQTRLNWAYFKFANNDANLAIFGSWLYQLAEVATYVVNPSTLKFNEKKESKDDNSPKSTQSISYTNTQSETGFITKSTNQPDKKDKCPVCDSIPYHNLETCRKFKQLPIDQKWILVKKLRVCGGCFGDHHYFKCFSKKKCGKDGCTANHHVLLHNSIGNASETEVQNVSNSHRSLSTTTTFLDIFRIVPVQLSFKDKSIRIFAYLDDGSNLTSLEELVAMKIGVTGTNISLCVRWSLGDHQVESQSQIVSITIKGTFDGAMEYSMDHVRTVKKLNLPKQSITRQWLDQYPHLKNVPITTYMNARPQMIIGLQFSNLMVSLETIEGEWSQPIVCRTRLGWVVQGPNDKIISTRSTNYGLTMCECQPDDNHLHQLVREFFSIENFGVKTTNLLLESKEITRAKFFLETTVTKLNNRYKSALLWRRDDIILPSNYIMAIYNNWQAAQAMADKFWRAFIMEYLPTFTRIHRMLS